MSPDPLSTTLAQATAGSWPGRRTAMLDWLVTETQPQRFLDNIFVELCRRLRQAGIPVARATMHLRLNHPQWAGVRVLWRPGLDQAEMLTLDHGIDETDSFRNSPLKSLYDGAAEFRQRLDGEGDDGGHFPIVADLRAEGLSDYVAWPLKFIQDKRHIVTFAADRAGGFSPAELSLMADLLPALALVVEVRLKNRLARTLLETYVGPHASEEILNGAIRRGSGKTIRAAIMICDLRGFTAISEMWPRDDVIALLNEYFDAMSLPIDHHGGEILKFIGDGMLAIFPLVHPRACDNLIAAVSEARLAMSALNDSRVAKGMEALGYGVGVHFGDVMYGNIGSRARLDFTVIGPAVNVAARLESLTKEVGRTVLFSSAFVQMAEQVGMLERVGNFPLRGVENPIEVFAFREESAAVGVY